ncbi:hypothetical protein AMR76_16210 [Vibrio furnissii]|uniref:Uncharacterized protein n=1 Tax=Vibrio furnissii TaxID=29494 RepID=A0A0Q2MYQ4_VIBFU|nr:hypothetical protein AMR76_16210 [Vibrio furnissii]
MIDFFIVSLVYKGRKDGETVLVSTLCGEKNNWNATAQKMERTLDWVYSGCENKKAKPKPRFWVTDGIR